MLRDLGARSPSKRRASPTRSPRRRPCSDAIRKMCRSPCSTRRARDGGRRRWWAPAASRPGDPAAPSRARFERTRRSGRSCTRWRSFETETLAWPGPLRADRGRSRSIRSPSCRCRERRRGRPRLARRRHQPAPAGSMRRTATSCGWSRSNVAARSARCARRSEDERRRAETLAELDRAKTRSSATSATSSARRSR